MHKEDEIIRIIGRLEGSGIVYVRNRKLCRDIARTLNGKGVNSAAYHAGLDHVERAEIQQSWMENKARIIVATNAFGMGIDKGDVRFVIHHSLPPSLEEYYQEAGRAGRDEKRAYAILLYNEDDIFSAKRQWRTNYPEFGFIREVYGHLASFFEVAVGSGNEEVYVFDMIEFVNHFQLPLLPTISACKELEKNKWIYLSDAVFEPAKVMIQLNRNELEGSLKQHTKESRLLHLMIRNYESLFSTLVAISIKKLSILMKENVSIVHELLQKLDDAGVILYEPKTDSAQIRFLQDRVGKRNFSIDIKSFKLREEQARKRLKYMIRYVESLNCRENEILVYFSETKLKTCGRCDNCRGKQEVNYQSADLIHLTDMLALNCKDDFCGIEDFVDLFPTNEKKKILQLIDHFIHEGWLELNEYRIKWIKSDD